MICLLLLLFLTGMTLSGSDTTVEVKFVIELPYAVVAYVDRDDIVNGVRAFLPLYIDIDSDDLVGVDVFNQDGKIGVAVVIRYSTPKRHHVLVQMKTLVTCGTPIDVPIPIPVKLPDITADPYSFEVEYSAGVDPVLTGDELIDCPGAIEPPAGTNAPKITRRPRPTMKPSAGCRKTPGMKFISTLALLVAVLIVY